MATLAPKPDDSFEARIAAAQQALSESIMRAGLQKDPYRHVHEALAVALGTFPELVQHLEATRQPVRDNELRVALGGALQAHAGAMVRSLSWGVWLAVVGLLVVVSAASAGAGYWFRGAVPVLVGVHAGAEKCDDRPDGSRLCWIPVFERLPVTK